MQLEELRRQWGRLDEKLERTLKMQGELLRLSVTRAARRRVDRAAIWPALDIAFSLGVILFAGSFMVEHGDSSTLVCPAGVVMAASFLLLIDSVRQLIVASGIDWGGALLEIQDSLARLRMAKIRQFKWVILLSPLVGFCGLLVGVQWLLDRLPEPHYLLDKLNPWWVAGNYASGVLFVPFGHAVVRFLAKRFHGSGWWQRALDDISGESMKKTKDELARWAGVDATTSLGADPGDASASI